jgi:hypothetical protein
MWKVKINSNDIANETDMWVATIPVINPSEVMREKSDVYMFDGGMEDNKYYHSSASMDVTYHGLDFDNLLGIISRKYVSEALVGSGVSNGVLPEYATLWLYNTNNYYDGKVYKILHAYITGTERKQDNYGRVSVKYELYPFRFDSDLMVIKALSSGNNSFTNNGDITKPIYEGIGEGSIQIDINSPFQIIGDGIPETIDSRKRISSNEPHVLGDYEDLYIPHGTHNIKITGITDAQMRVMTGVYI